MSTDEKAASREQRLKDLRREVSVGLDASDRGELTVYDDASLKARFDEIKAEGRKRLAEMRRT